MPPEALPIPAQMQEHVDALVHAAAGGSRALDHPSFEVVASWCETADEGAAVCSADYGGSVPLVWLESEVERWSDAEIAHVTDRPGDEPLSDAERVAFLRSRLVGLLDGEVGEEALELPLLCDVRLKAADGRTASIGYILRSYGPFGGPEVEEWVGVYRDLEELRDEYRARGAVTSDADVAAVDDVTLLGMWVRYHQQEAGRTSRRKRR